MKSCSLDIALRLAFPVVALGLCSFSLAAEEQAGNASLPADALVAASSEAEIEIEPVYQVEFILFRAKSRPQLLQEDWPQDKPEIAQAELFNSPTALPQPLEDGPFFSWVDESQRDFSNTLRRLENSADYEVLKHVAWRQQATPRDNATAYLLQLPFDEQNQALAIAQSPTESPAESLEDGELENAGLDRTIDAQALARRFNNADNGSFQAPASDDLGAEPNPLNEAGPPAGVFGQLAFSKARYLHFSVDLLMSENEAVSEAIENNAWQASWQQQSPLNVGDSDSNGIDSSSFGGDAGFNIAANEAQLNMRHSLGLSQIDRLKQQHYHLKESRRIKTEQTHYFDHPAFGVLVHVRRLSPEEFELYQAELMGDSLNPDDSIESGDEAPAARPISPAPR